MPDLCCVMFGHLVLHLDQIEYILHVDRGGAGKETLQFSQCIRADSRFTLVRQVCCRLVEVM